MQPSRSKGLRGITRICLMSSCSKIAFKVDRFQEWVIEENICETLEILMSCPNFTLGFFRKKSRNQETSLQKMNCPLPTYHLKPFVRCSTPQDTLSTPRNFAILFSLEKRYTRKVFPFKHFGKKRVKVSKNPSYLLCHQNSIKAFHVSES